MSKFNQGVPFISVPFPIRWIMSEGDKTIHAQVDKNAFAPTQKAPLNRAYGAVFDVCISSCVVPIGAPPLDITLWKGVKQETVSLATKDKPYAKGVAQLFLNMADFLCPNFIFVNPIPNYSPLILFRLDQDLFHWQSLACWVGSLETTANLLFMQSNFDIACIEFSYGYSLQPSLGAWKYPSEVSQLKEGMPTKVMSTAATASMKEPMTDNGLTVVDPKTGEVLLEGMSLALLFEKFCEPLVVPDVFSVPGMPLERMDFIPVRWTLRNGFVHIQIRYDFTKLHTPHTLQTTVLTRTSYGYSMDIPVSNNAFIVYSQDQLEAFLRATDVGDTESYCSSKPYTQGRLITRIYGGDKCCGELLFEPLRGNNAALMLRYVDVDPDVLSTSHFEADDWFAFCLAGMNVNCLDS